MYNVHDSSSPTGALSLLPVTGLLPQGMQWGYGFVCHFGQGIHSVISRRPSGQ